MIFRTAQNLSAEGERHGTSHQLQQPIRRQRDAPPHGFIHTPPPQPRTKTSRATTKRPPMSSVPISISGLVVEYIVAIDGLQKNVFLPRSRSTQIFMCGSNNPRPTYGPGFDSQLMQFALSCICAHVLWEKTKPRSKNPQLHFVCSPPGSPITLRSTQTLHTPPPQPRTKTSRATKKRPPMSSVPTSISGLVVEYIVACDPGSIPG